MQTGGIHNSTGGQECAAVLKKAYENLKKNDIAAANELLDQALSVYYENKEVKHALKCVRWWMEYSGGCGNIKNPYEKGAYILSLIKKYNDFIGNYDSDFDQCQYAVRFYVYSMALGFFKNLLGSPVNQHDPNLLLMVGRCYKGIGNYEEALQYLGQAIRFKREDAETLAEVADVNALLAETITAKTLFKEAFYIDASKIDLKTMESALILALRDKVAKLGYGDENLCEWIPVYGYLWGVFSVKRELKPVEVGRLKQSVYQLELERDANPERREKIKPKLLNRYFWMIDHYENSSRDSSLIEEVLLKIKVTDPEIYSMYAG